MSRQTKSFFNQDNSKKSHYWHNNRNHQHPSAASNNAVTSKSPLPASLETRMKLKEFVYAGPEQQRASMITAGASAKSAPEMNTKTTPDAPAASLDRRSADSNESRKISLQHANTFPSTPAERLTLDELIGVVDNSTTKETVDNSPDEILGWNPNSSYQATTPGRKRKRAHSSSPTCPNSEKIMDPLPQMVHKTPIMDPATELWHRYGGQQKEGAIQLPDISFALQATPRPIETPVKSTGLRRWASAGNDWPSRSKRQRTNTPKVLEDRSKLATMLQKVQDSLADSKLERRRTDDPSSSSPLPEIGLKQIPPQGPPKPRAPLTVQSPNHAARSRVPLQQKPTMKLPAFTSHKDSIAARKLQQAQQQKAVPSASTMQPRKTTTPKKPQVVELIEEDFLDDTADLFDSTDFDELTMDEALSNVSNLTTKTKPQTSTMGYQRHVVDARTDAKHLAAFAEVPNDLNDDDEFGLTDMDEQGLLDAELTATQAFAKPRNDRHITTPLKGINRNTRSTILNSQQLKWRYRRFRVQKVYECSQSTNLEKILLAEDEVSKLSTTITLRGTWLDTDVEADQVIHISLAPSIAAEDSTWRSNHVFIDDHDTSPLLILHPDHMLSATSVAESFDCVRKAVLSDRVKMTSDANKWTVYGKILHEVFQQALIANKWDPDYLNKLVINTTQAHLEGLWSIGMRDDVLAIEEIQAKMQELSAWAGVFVRDIPSADARVRGLRDEGLRIAITGLIAVEEHVWSPMFGLKGNVDATVQIDQIGKSSKLMLAPFEVKTGRAKHSSAHHAQTSLYTLLMSDRYDVAIKTGILYYLESSEVSLLSPTIREMRDMMQQRNRLATALHNARFAQITAPTQLQAPDARLPPMLKSPFRCGTCYSKQTCFSYHALCEEGTANTAGLVDDGKKDHNAVWLDALGHLMTGIEKDAFDERKLKDWFSKWDRLLTFEELTANQSLKELWTMSSGEREAAGRCFGRLKIRLDHLASSSSQHFIDGIQSSGGKVNKFVYTFERGPGSRQPFDKGSQLVAGEAIVISSEQGQWALAKGYVMSVRNDCITVGVARRLGDARQRLQNFDADNRQSLKGIMKVGVQSSAAQDHTTLYRIDKDEFANGLSMIRNNLVTAMSSHPCHTRLRDLIILDIPPTFEKVDKLNTLRPTQLEEMNEDQQAAVAKVTSAQDYALILGMPGTGKTTTIAHIIRALIADGKSILLTSYTHTAVDNILLKIRDIAPAGSILRLGNSTKVSPQVKGFCHVMDEPCKSFEEIKERYEQTQIVATTCLGIGNALFAQRYFDVCIVDEASQITLPVSLGPLLNARKFVLVGDHYQLSPLVQSRNALEGGLDMSLFRLLSQRHPEAVAMLGKQYRMCEDIMSISNALIYDGRLRCGSGTVARRTIQYISPSGLDMIHASSSCSNDSTCLLSTVTDRARKVVFVNTDNIAAARESLVNGGKKITNRLEAGITAQIVLSLQALGLPSSDIGVIALYRTQIALIRQIFDAAAMTADVELDSADRFQGRDKECVIISMVRSNETGMVGELIKDWRRLNVAFTRARSKLIVIGSRDTLRSNELMARFLQLVDGKQQSLDLPADAETSHGSAFNFVSKATAIVEQRSSPAKRWQTPFSSPWSKVLQESQGGANRGVVSSAKSGKPVSPSKITKAYKTKALKIPAKIVDGRSGGIAQKSRKLKEQLAFEIFEELTADDWDL